MNLPQSKPLVDPLNPKPIASQEGTSNQKTQVASAVHAPDAPSTIPKAPQVNQGIEVPIDWKEQAQARISEVVKYYDKYAGKVGCNPYEYYVSRIKPLLTTLDSFDSMFEFYTPKEDGTISKVSKETFIKWLWTSIQALEMKESYALHDRNAYNAELLRQKTVAEDKASGRKQVIIQ